MPKKNKKSKKKIKKIRPKRRGKKISSKKRRVIKKRKKLKKARKIKRKIRFKPKIELAKIKLKSPKFNFFKKISFQGTVEWLLNPFFKGWDHYLERKRARKIAQMEFERREKIRLKKEESRLRLEAKKKALQEEKKIEIERRKDLKQFISQGQALLRAEQAEEKRKVYEAMKIQRRLDQFAKREAKEIADLNRYALREEISQYSEIQSRIDKIRAKYSAIREEKFRKNYEEMGIDVQASDTREDLYEKHRIFEEQRKKVEQVLESFFRGAMSLVFQLNRRWIPKNLEILRIIDRRWEENLFYIRLDDEVEENWLMNVYLLDGKTDKPVIVVEDKTAEKYITKQFNTSNIFQYSDWMVDRWTQFLDRQFKLNRKKSN